MVTKISLLTCILFSGCVYLEDISLLCTVLFWSLVPKLSNKATKSILRKATCTQQENTRYDVTTAFRTPFHSFDSCKGTTQPFLHNYQKKQRNLPFITLTKTTLGAEQIECQMETMTAIEMKEQRKSMRTLVIQTSYAEEVALLFAMPAIKPTVDWFILTKDSTSRVLRLRSAAVGR